MKWEFSSWMIIIGIILFFGFIFFTIGYEGVYPSYICNKEGSGVFYKLEGERVDGKINCCWYEDVRLENNIWVQDRICKAVIK